jgi:peroxiredoxin
MSVRFRPRQRLSKLTIPSNDGWFLPIPATFVIGRDGRVLARFLDPDFRRRMPLNDSMNALRAAFPE